MASLAPLRQLASALRTSAAARPQLRLSRSSVGSAPPHLCLPPSRVLSTQGLKGRGRSERGKEEEKAHGEYIKEVTRRTDGGGVPKFRLPPPPAPTTHSESWALASHISPDPEENVLSFRTRFYLESSMAFTNGLQPEYQTKVVMMVKIHKLGLSAEEVQRILAVCPPNWYDKKTRLLKLQNNKFRSVRSAWKPYHLTVRLSFHVTDCSASACTSRICCHLAKRISVCRFRKIRWNAA